MTLQQMEYIVAVNQYRHFLQAAEACGVTQPTLSAMIAKLEDEFGVKIFDRSNKSVKPTAVGKKIISQAQHALAEANKVREIVDETKGFIDTDLKLLFGQSIGTYLIPGVIEKITTNYKSIRLSIEEMKSVPMMEQILKGNADMGVSVTGNSRNGILEIPLYTEPFHIYLSDDFSKKMSIFHPEQLSSADMWIMRDAQCFRDSAFSFCNGKELGHHIYEAGNIETLIRIVDCNGGYTIIPEMQLPFLSEDQRYKVKDIEGDFISYRKVSLYIRADEVRQRLVQTVIDVIKQIVPSTMHNAFIQKNIRL